MRKETKVKCPVRKKRIFCTCVASGGLNGLLTHQERHRKIRFFPMKTLKNNALGSGS